MVLKSEEKVMDARHFRQVLSHFPTGVVVVTADGDSGPVGMTLQSFMSLSLDPALILLSIDRSSTTWPIIEARGSFGVNVLSTGQAFLARQFAQRGTDKFAGVTYRPGEKTGSPLLEESVAWLECAVRSSYDGGDHIIVVASVLDLDTNESVQDPALPLLFFKSGFPAIAP